jgi:hypothetical protein
MTVRQFLRNSQTRGAFIAASTSEKQLATNKKSLFRHWPLIMNFFVAYFSILVRCKTKGAVGAVCALLRIWPLSAYRPIVVLNGAESLKGFHAMGDGRIFLKNRRASSFYKDLLNEPNFGRIYLAGQYL